MATLVLAVSAGLALAGTADIVETARIPLPAGVEVRFVAISPDGRQLTAACADRKLRVWAIPPAGAGLLRTLDVDGEPVTGLAYSDGGTWLAARTRQGTLAVVRAGTGESQPRLRATGGGRVARVDALAVSRDGSRVAAGPPGAPAELWDVASGRRQAVLTTRFAGSNALEFSPDGTRLASADEDTAIRVYDADGRLQATADGLTLESFAVAFTPDGKRLAVGGADRTITLLDAATGALVRTLPKQEQPILWLAMTGRTTVVSGSFLPRSMRIPGPTLAWPLDGGPARVLATDREFVGRGAADDGRFLLASIGDGALVVWAVR